jgi:RNA polymerase sigma factor (sigma-70 family)
MTHICYCRYIAFLLIRLFLLSVGLSTGLGAQDDREATAVTAWRWQQNQSAADIQASITAGYRLGDKLRGDFETQDFVQDAVIDVLTYGPRFTVSGEMQFRMLLGKIVENNLRDRARWQGRECRDPERVRPLPTDTVLRLDPPVRSVTRPSEVVEREERRAWVRLAIDLLEAKDRDVIWMRDWERMSFSVIGEQLGIGTNAAHLRYRHALPRLMQKVKYLRGGEVVQAIDL